MALTKEGYAALSGGPEDGRSVYLGGCRRLPPKIDFDADGRLARYRRCTRFQFDPFRAGGAGHIGKTTYRFVGYVAATEIA